MADTPSHDPRKPKLPALSGDMAAVFEELNEECSDRARAIVACAYLEDILESMLRARLCGESVSSNGNMKAPIEDIVERPQFAGKLDLCFCLGLIGPTAYHDLKIINTIRNRFAHKRTRLAFTDSKVESEVAKLRTPEALEKASSLRFGPGDRFISAATQLMSQLLLTGLGPSPIPVGKDYTLAAFVKG